MKEWIKLDFDKGGSASYGDALQSATIEILRAKFPSGATRPGAFAMEFESGSRDLAEAYEIILKSDGLAPSDSRFPVGGLDKRGRFRIGGRIEYSGEEIAESRYCRVTAVASWADSRKVNDEGNIVIERKGVLNTFVGSGGAVEILIGEDVKDRFERMGFEGLSFRPVELLGEGKRQGRVWQLWSSIELPPMKSRKTDRGNCEFVVDDDGCDGFFIDDFTSPPRILYSREDLEKIGNIDIGRTIEHFGSWRSREIRVPMIICSARFRNWCESELIGLSWQPVIVEGRRGDFEIYSNGLR